MDALYENAHGLTLITIKHRGRSLKTKQLCFNYVNSPDFEIMYDPGDWANLFDFLEDGHYYVVFASVGENKYGKAKFRPFGIIADFGPDRRAAEKFAHKHFLMLREGVWDPDQSTWDECYKLWTEWKADWIQAKIPPKTAKKKPLVEM